MALTQVKTTGLADDAVTGAKIADDTVAEANMANDAISLTELKAGTDGQIITWDASGNPTAVGPGTDGQVLTSTGAGSPPAFETIAASPITALNNATANELVTVGSTTTELDAESGLTFDGANQLKMSGSGQQDLIIGSTDAGGAAIALDGDSNGDASGNDYALIRHNTSGDLEFVSKNPSGATNTIFKQGSTERFRIRSDGDVEITDGNLIIETAGHGINFHPHGGSNVNLLDDYEEGTWTPRLGGGNNIGTYNITGTGTYTKIGRLVFANLRFDNQDLNNSASGTVRIDQLPFTPNAGGLSPEAYSIWNNFLTYNGYFDAAKRQGWEIQSGGILVGLEMANGGAWAGWSVGSFDLGSFYMNGSFTYITAS